MFEPPLLEAIRTGDSERSRKLLLEQFHSHSLQLENQGPRKDGPALYWASCNGMADVVEMILTFGGKVNSATSWGATALHAAADNNHINVARILIQWGANVNKQTECCSTPAHLAAFRGHATMLRTLMDASADVTMQNDQQQDVLGVASSRGHERIVKHLQNTQTTFSDTLDAQAPSTRVTVVDVQSKTVCNRQPQREAVTCPLPVATYAVPWIQDQNTISPPRVQTVCLGCHGYSQSRCCAPYHQGNSPLSPRDYVTPHIYHPQAQYRHQNEGLAYQYAQYIPSHTLGLPNENLNQLSQGCYPSYDGND